MSYKLPHNSRVIEQNRTGNDLVKIIRGNECRVQNQSALQVLFMEHQSSLMACNILCEVLKHR